MLRLLHLLLIVLTVATYLPPIVHPQTFWPISTLGLIAPLCWFMVLLFGVYWLFRRDKAIFLSIITLLLGWDMITNAYAVSPLSSSPPADALVIASLNGHTFRRDQGEDAPTFNQRVATYFQALDADIVLVQEFQTRSNKAPYLVKAIRENADFPHVYSKVGESLAIFSRYPLSNEQPIYFKNRGNGFLCADVQTPQGTIRVFNIHLQTNAISTLASEVTTTGNLREKSTWQKIKTMFGRYGRSNKVRTAQAEQILSVISKSPHPVLAGGDFNDIPTSYLYHAFRERLQDAHLAGSWGLGSTYKGLLPGLRIDYLLPDQHFQIQDFERRDCPFSDHQAVLATMSLENGSH